MTIAPERGDDADNINVEEKTRRIFTGYGSGALIVVDLFSRTKVANISLKAHPEAFELDRATGKSFVNVLNAGQIAAVDVASEKQVATWALRDARSNFPMAFDNGAKEVNVAFRKPAKLMVFGAHDGHIAATLDICGDADDVLADSKWHHIYVSCGGGFSDIFETSVRGYDRITRIPTVSGARTAFLVSELDKLFLAVRATRSKPAAVWVFKLQL